MSIGISSWMWWAAGVIVFFFLACKGVDWLFNKLPFEKGPQGVQGVQGVQGEPLTVRGIVEMLGGASPFPPGPGIMSEADVAKIMQKAKGGRDMADVTGIESYRGVRVHESNEGRAPMIFVRRGVPARPTVDEANEMVSTGKISLSTFFEWYDSGFISKEKDMKDCGCGLAGCAMGNPGLVDAGQGKIENGASQVMRKQAETGDSRRAGDNIIGGMKSTIASESSMQRRVDVGMGCAGQASPPPTEPRVTSSLERAFNALRRVEELHTMLAKKLAPVMRGEIGQDPRPGIGQEIDAPMVPLAAQLDAMTYRLNDAAEDVRELLNRVEL